MLMLSLLASAVLTACKDDDPFLSIGSDETITVPNTGGDFDIAVNTNLDYYEFRFEDGDWLTGKVTGAGITLTAEPNSLLTERKAVFKVVSLDHPGVNRSVHIVQEGTYLRLTPQSVPYLKPGGETVALSVETNMADGEWSVSVKNGDGWLTASAETPGAIELTAGPNADAYPRMASLSVVSSRFESLNISLPVVQSGTDETIESVIYTEDFSWMKDKNGTPFSPNIWDDKTQLEFKDWPAGHGWQASNNGSGNYTRLGYVKMGRAALSSDLITPKMSAIEGSRDILVVFKSFTFMDKDGKADDNVFCMSVIGDGTITEIRKSGSQLATPAGKQASAGSLTQDGALFYIGNYNNPDASTRPNWIDVPGYDHLAPELAERSFVVSGATRNTQIRFLAGNTLGTISAPNRIGFDNVLVAILKNQNPENSQR